MINNKSDQPIPALYRVKEDCFGCTACYASCPKSAISMEPDEEGFLYPFINPEKCVRCHQCLKVCPVKITKGLQLDVY